jgi:hypothetical protein
VVDQYNGYVRIQRLYMFLGDTHVWTPFWTIQGVLDNHIVCMSVAVTKWLAMRASREAVTLVQAAVVEHMAESLLNQEE